VLGAIISPPDVVAPLAIANRLGLPRRLRVILEGEGLVNDATARSSTGSRAAVSTGGFAGPPGARRDLRRRDPLGLGSAG
jgi:CPA1 family monovalent cation:H+ antiporter